MDVSYKVENFLAMVRFAGPAGITVRVDAETVLEWVGGQYRMYYVRSCDLADEFGVAYDVLDPDKIHDVWLVEDDDILYWKDADDIVRETTMLYKGIQPLSGESMARVMYDAELKTHRVTYTDPTDVWFYSPAELVRGMQELWKKDMAPQTIAASLNIFLCLEDKFPEKIALQRLLDNYLFTKAPRASEEAAIKALVTMVEDMYQPDETPEDLLNYHGWWTTYKDEKTNTWYAGTIRI